MIFYTMNILIIIVKLFKAFDTNHLHLMQMIRHSTHQLRKMLPSTKNKKTN